jgi:putative membrane protein
MLHALFFWPFFFFAPFHGLFSLIFIVVIVSLIFGRRRYYYGYHPHWWHGGGDANRSEALSLLHARYARGEIQREEYLQKKQDLGG